MQVRFLKRLSGKTPREQNSSGKKIGAESAVLHFVFFIVIVNKMQQSAKESGLLKSKTMPEVFPLTIGSGKTVPFEKRRSRYKETAENKAEAYRVYVEHLFSACDAVDARIFSKGDGETIIYTYDKGGQLKGVSGVKNTVKGSETYSYIDTIVYDEHGQRVYIKYGNGVETRYRYDDKRRWLKDIETRNKQTDEIFQKISYRFDKVGNVLGYSNDASVYETSQSYTYDSLYQLIGVEGTSNQYKAIKSFGSTPVNVAKYKQDFAFDGIGNMTRKASTTNIPGSRGNAYPKAELDYSLDYEYDPSYAHRLVHAGNRYYRYDANGNITAEKDGPFTEDDEFIFTYSYDPDTDVYSTDYGFGLDAPKETEETHPENLFAYRRNYTWNEKNLLTKSSDRTYTVHYRYGEDGQRALKYTEEGRSETLYFNNFYTIHIPVQDKNNPQGLRVHKHIFVGNSRLVTAMTHTDNNGDNAEQREKRYYYHSDHLGSAQFVTDWRGKQYEHIEYTPYGELWIEEVSAGLDKLPFRFTGKEMDEETGLYYYGARYLDPKYSRWLSGDPALSDYIPEAPIDDEAKKHNENLPGMGGVFNVVNLHLYHYAGNNPVKYTDPDGKIVIAPAVVWGINATLFGYGVVASRNDEIGFAARHPIIAVQLGLPKDGGRHGINSAASNFAINSGLSKFAFTGASQDLGSKKGAYRHAVWQAIICSKFGENIATEVGNSHDPITPGKQSSYTSLDDADTYCDQMNNIIGRTLGKDSNLSNKELALKALDIFHDAGLYTVSQNKDGSYSVGITRINDSEYNTAYSEILKRNNQGLLE